MADITAWRVAYAKQAGADLDARDVLQRQPQLPACQHLHFLQMACEKICKAHLCGTGSDPKDLQSSHAYVASILPRIVRQYVMKFSGNAPPHGTWIVRAIRKLARKIELLAPSVDDAGRYPANCEYPWQNPKGEVVAPAEHNFQMELLYEEGGRHLLKILRIAVEELARRE